MALNSIAGPRERAREIKGWRGILAGYERTAYAMAAYESDRAKARTRIPLVRAIIAAIVAYGEGADYHAYLVAMRAYSES